MEIRTLYFSCIRLDLCENSGSLATGYVVIFLEFLCQIILTGIVAYIGRNVIQLIPFPLDGLYGFIHMRVKEVSSGSLLTSITSMFQLSLQEKISYLRKVQNNEYDEKEKKEKEEKENKENKYNTIDVDNNNISSR